MNHGERGPLLSPEIVIPTGFILALLAWLWWVSTAEIHVEGWMLLLNHPTQAQQTQTKGTP